MARLRIAAAARRDIDHALQQSLDSFGDLAQQRYEALIALTLSDLASDPLRLGGKELPGAKPGLRAYHLASSRARATEAGVQNPRHIIVYRLAAPDTVVVMRVLHDTMDLLRHLA